MVLLFLFVALLMNSSGVPDLDALRWQSRVLLVFSSSDSDLRLLEERRALAGALKELGERQVKVFELIGGTEPVLKLRERFGVKEQEFAVVLVGKDGGRKLRSLKPVTPEETFRLIDSMPMRREEMKARPSP